MRRSAAVAVLALLLAACSASSVPPRPATWARPPQIPEGARHVSLVVVEGSCWGSSSVVRKISVADQDRFLVWRSAEAPEVERSSWSSTREHLTKALVRTRPREGLCRAGANANCRFSLQVDEAPVIEGCCEFAGGALYEVVKGL